MLEELAYSEGTTVGLHIKALEKLGRTATRMQTSAGIVEARLTDAGWRYFLAGRYDKHTGDYVMYHQPGDPIPNLA